MTDSLNINDVNLSTLLDASLYPTIVSKGPTAYVETRVGTKVSLTSWAEWLALVKIAAEREAGCVIECDDDCEAGCHMAHNVSWKRPKGTPRNTAIRRPKAAP